MNDRSHLGRSGLAWLALTSGVLGLLALAAAEVANFPRALAIAGSVVIALLCAWAGLIRRGAARWAWWALALIASGLGLWYVFSKGGLLEAEDIVVIVCGAIFLGAMKRAFSVHDELRLVSPPKRAVLFYNPKSGGGKAERFHLADEARKRGIEPRELTPGADLAELVRQAIADGFDALAMAGGDGSQAIVAAHAAEHGLLYACIPSGTRNHFALDLGVDRDDVVGALDALVAGRERVVDLAEVNGRVFVNNVSLGLYAEAVQEQGYRDAKIRTLLATAPKTIGADGGPPSFRFRDSHGREQGGGPVLLVSNDVYRLGAKVASGTRPALDAGVLGIASVDSRQSTNGRPPRLRQWSAPDFEVLADAPLPVGVDGESMVLEPPLEFRSRPRALRVLIAPQHPGASPSAGMPPNAASALRELFALALLRRRSRPRSDPS